MRSCVPEKSKVLEELILRRRRSHYRKTLPPPKVYLSLIPQVRVGLTKYVVHARGGPIVCRQLDFAEEGSKRKTAVRDGAHAVEEEI